MNPVIWKYSTIPEIKKGQLYWWNHCFSKALPRRSEMNLLLIMSRGKAHHLPRQRKTQSHQNKSPQPWGEGSSNIYNMSCQSAAEYRRRSSDLLALSPILQSLLDVIRWSSVPGQISHKIMFIKVFITQHKMIYTQGSLVRDVSSRPLSPFKSQHVRLEGSSSLFLHGD